MRYAADISPAIRELKKLHLALLDEGNLAGAFGQLSESARNYMTETIISVVPGERRREMGWYKWRKWEKKSDELLHALDEEHEATKYHEIFIAGEALKEPAAELVLLMMHQVVHQCYSVMSKQSYHADWMREGLNRVFGIPIEAVERDEILGWAKVDRTKLDDKSRDLVNRLAHRMKPENLDLYRNPAKKYDSVGKMKLWHCQDCRRPAKLRTGAIVDATCNLCNTRIVYADKDRFDEEVRESLVNRGAWDAIMGLWVLA